MSKSKIWGLTVNQLKLIGLVLMTVDHAGMLLLPQYPVLRMIGRVAMPIFAYMIAEGFAHTHSKGGYLLRIVITAALVQTVQFFFGDSMYLYQSILVTFTLSLLLMICLDFAAKRKLLSWLLPLVCGGAIWFVCEMLGKYLPGFAVDYGFFGVLLPVIIHFGRDRLSRWWLAAFGIAMLSWRLGGIQWYSLCALLPLALYNGRHGKIRMRWVFYFYFPGHLAALQLLAQILQS